MVFVYVAELLQVVLATRDAFRTFGPGWGDIEILDQVGWVWFSIPVMSSISKTHFLSGYFTVLIGYVFVLTVSFTVQMFFAWRIRILSRKNWIPLAILIVSLCLQTIITRCLMDFGRNVAFSGSGGLGNLDRCLLAFHRRFHAR